MERASSKSNPYAVVQGSPIAVGSAPTDTTVRFLASELAPRRRLRDDLVADAQRRGISKSRLYRAARRLDVVVVRRQGLVWWELPRGRRSRTG